MKFYMFRENGTKDSKNKINKKKVIVLIVVILMIAITAATIILYKKNENFKNICDNYIFRKNAYEDNLPTINLEAGTNIYAYNKSIILLNQYNLKSYNQYGVEEYSLNIEITTPIFESNGNYLCIAEKNGSKIYLISGRNIIWQKDIEGNISNVTVNKNGYVSIAITGTSYKTVVEAFENNGSELFKKHLSKTNVIDIDISNDNKYLAIAEANFSGIMIQCNIEIIEVEKARKGDLDSIIYTYDAPIGDLLINIKYQSKNKLLCLYDKQINSIIDKENIQVSSFSDEKVLFSDINLNLGCIKVIKEKSGILNADAEMQIIQDKVITYKIDGNPKEITTYGNMIGINLGTEALFVNESGWLVKKYTSSQEIKDIIINDNCGVSVFKDKIELISL